MIKDYFGSKTPGDQNKSGDQGLGSLDLKTCWGRRLVGIEDWLGSKTTGDQRLGEIEDSLGSKSCWDQSLEIEDKVRLDRRIGDSLGSKTWDQRLLGSKTWDRILGIKGLLG